MPLLKLALKFCLLHARSLWGLHSKLAPRWAAFLAAFEGDEYYKVNVRPQLEDASSVDAIMYVWHERCGPGHASLLLCVAMFDMFLADTGN